MRKADPTHNSVVVSAAELAEVVGIDLETVNNWLRRGIIRRAHVGGRPLRNWLFSTDEVYKAALTNELVQLGIAPTPSNDAVNELWKEWRQTKLQDGGNVYAVLFPNDHKSSVILCWQKQSRGPLLRLSKSSGTESAEFELPRQAFAIMPISDVAGDVTKRLVRLLVQDKKHNRKDR